MSNMRDFTQHHWQAKTERDFERLLELALVEDTETQGDLTSLALLSAADRGSATIVARTAGVLAGMPLVPKILSAVDSDLVWEPALEDSTELTRGTIVGTIRGSASGILIAERLVLNFLGRLSGVATLTKRYVDAIRGTNAHIYDTRKTTPGWRRLEKYAVRCGGGRNHRTGLYDAVLIKDNHLALGRQGEHLFSPAQAVQKAKELLRIGYAEPLDADSVIVEIEVDTLDQLREVLPAGPDIVLLDNMTPPQITEAIQIRNMVNPGVQLEASGGITLETIRAVAETGVERISVGALTHSAVSLDFGLDWK
ncbi:MAG: carboxylating nicotinate-nucleotide diphosphorylase [Planctomycetaceae bacterium]|nr:carboxylating nicotinate-nucleotide diphosphorylase [Planctomycetaceae bacterium]